MVHTHICAHTDTHKCRPRRIHTYVHTLTQAYTQMYRVGDQSLDISIIGQLYYTIKKLFYLKFCIKHLVASISESCV